MKLVELLLGIGGQEEAYPAIVSNNEGQSIPIFTPVIVEKDMGLMRSTIYFPSSKDHKHRGYVHLSEKVLIPLQPKGLIYNRRVKTIDEFEYRKLRKIQEFIRSEAAVTFIIEKPEASIEFMKNLGYFKKEFPCTSFCGNITSGNSKTSSVIGDLLSLVVTIYDLRYAIPIYNKRKVDGMAVTISVLWPKSSEKLGRLAFVNEMHFIANSCPDNVLFVDGVSLREKSFVGTMYISHCIDKMTNEIERRKSEKDILSKIKTKK
jgi:hypothetical protein